MESLATSVVVGGRYRLDGVLGEGGMARVFDAFDLTLERPVAVKVLRPEADALPDVQRRFQQEARFAAQIHHPHIVAILDFGEDKGHSYLVMERLPGTTLRNEMAAGPISPQRTLMVVSEMLTALRAAHRHGVLHRDIKPSNVLLQDDGHTKLTDFGIAKGINVGRPLPSNPDETMTGVVLGTPGYVAPERAAGLPASVAVGPLFGRSGDGGGADRQAPHRRRRDTRGFAAAVATHRWTGTGSGSQKPLRVGRRHARRSPAAREPGPTTHPGHGTTTTRTCLDNVERDAVDRHITDLSRSARPTAALTHGLGPAPAATQAVGGGRSHDRWPRALSSPPFSSFSKAARSPPAVECQCDMHRVASTSTTVTPTTFATTNTTFLTTTTLPKHHGGSLLHQLHKAERKGIQPPAGGHKPGNGVGRGSLG